MSGLFFCFLRKYLEGDYHIVNTCRFANAKTTDMELINKRNALINREVKFFVGV